MYDDVIRLKTFDRPYEVSQVLTDVRSDSNIELYNPDNFVRFDQSCQPCSGCPMRPCPPERSCPPKYICPPSSPYKICIVPPIPQKPSWKPCCMRVYDFPCNRHRRPEKFIRFTDLDLFSQFLSNVSIE
ncbi:hypothetical protein V1478_002523 [Vespula squamosa]|uniref:Uncharacterized protein n=1 Tax=Vespula squamosa TaxID=30214 RepID=A0ABD2BTB2_VESSQ